MMSLLSEKFRRKLPVPTREGHQPISLSIFLAFASALQAQNFLSPVYLILDEFILAGELQETSKKAIIERMAEIDKMD